MASNEQPHDQPQVILSEQTLRGLTAHKTVQLQSNRQHPHAEAEWHWLNILFPPARPRDILIQFCGRLWAAGALGSFALATAPYWWGTADLIPFMIFGLVAAVILILLARFVTKQVPDGGWLLLYLGFCLLAGVALLV